MKKINKMCSFYVNEWHLTMMILPHINKEIENKNEITIISEQNLELHIQSILSRLNTKTEMKEKINKIDWKETENPERKIKNIKENTNIIIIGNKEYIENVNKIIEEKIQNQHITIINCYEVMQFNNNMEQILCEHDKVLNTSGSRDIEEIFDGYNQKEVI